MALNLKNEFLAYCLNNDYKYEIGYNWCDCVDYRKFINVVIQGKTHTFYCLDSGEYRFDKTIVKSIEEIERCLYG